MDYQESLSYLDGLAVFGIKPGLQRIERLLELLDFPQRSYRTIHVTGTNGKGSVSSMLTEVLREAGIHTGLFTSPHLVSYRERFQVDGRPISEEDFAACTDTVSIFVEKMKAQGWESPTQFEVLTAMGFFWFAMRHVEYAVIEVGLGGLLDSTNVIVPELSVITNVTMEHADKCGGTLEGIAHHKAGIIKEGVPVVTAARGEALDIIRREAEEKGADVFIEGEDFFSRLVSFEEKGQHMEFSSPVLGISGMDYELHLLGSYQQENSAVAIMAAALLRADEKRITSAGIAQAMARTAWAGRFELLNIGKQKVIVDGAHNPAGMLALRTSLDLYFPEGRRVFLLGILKDKEIGAMLCILLRSEDMVVASTPDSERAALSEMVAQEAGKLAHHAESVPEPGAALRRALGLARGEHLLVAAGSLYLIGELRPMILSAHGEGSDMDWIKR